MIGLGLFILVLFGTMGILYYRFCKESADKVLKFLKKK